MKILSFLKCKDVSVVLLFAILSAMLWFVPTGFEAQVNDAAIHCKGRVIATEDSEIMTLGLVRAGEQVVTLELVDGPRAGEVVTGVNPLLGQLDRDKVFAPGDLALVVLSLGADGEILYVNPQAHYRLDLEFLLLGMFALLLVLFGGLTGLKALLSFLFTVLMLWKVLVPLMLRGFAPVPLALGVVAILSGAIIFLVAGVGRKGQVAFAGTFLGILSSCALALWFTDAFHIHGAIMPFSETLLYSGYADLDMTGIFMAAVFIASSGAVMDLAMDVSASMAEVVDKKPGIGRLEAFGSGIRVGRAVVGTMTTTLLLAYSGGYITLMMAFMAQGIPMESMFNLIYVAAEVLKTLVGSFGLVLVAPFTAAVGAVLFVSKGCASAQGREIEAVEG